MDLFILLFGVCVLLALLLATRVLFLFKSMSTCLKDNVKGFCKLMVVIGSGGHTAEMMKLLEGFSSKYYPRIYVVGETDQRSFSKLETFENSREKRHIVIKIKRSREVAQSWISTIYTTMLALIDSFSTVFRHKPDLILCNGPGTCVPICLAAFVMRVFYLNNTKTIYVESICRVKTLSLSGKILYHFADQFLVQWEELQILYPKAKYLGLLV